MAAASIPADSRRHAELTNRPIVSPSGLRR
jgi:hypothetical protein